VSTVAIQNTRVLILNMNTGVIMLVL
jgi:hypothetical protein